MSKHRWVKEDDILACYIAKYGEEDFISVANSSFKRGIQPGSFRMRIQNFKALNGDGGLANWAKLSAEVYKSYRNVSREVHRSQCMELLKGTIKA